MTNEQISRLGDLLENRYRSDFAPKISVFNNDMTDLGILIWRRYLQRHNIRILHDSINNLLGKPREDEVAAHILWYQGIAMILAVPKDFALKCLVLGEFPPDDQELKNMTKPSAN
jgi:hypothetical protein